MTYPYVISSTKQIPYYLNHKQENSNPKQRENKTLNTPPNWITTLKTKQPKISIFKIQECPQNILLLKFPSKISFLNDVSNKIGKQGQEANEKLPPLAQNLETFISQFLTLPLASKYAQLRDPNLPEIIRLNLIPENLSSCSILPKKDFLQCPQRTMKEKSEALKRYLNEEKSRNSQETEKLVAIAVENIQQVFTQLDNSITSGSTEDDLDPLLVRQCHALLLQTQIYCLLQIRNCNTLQKALLETFQRMIDGKLLLTTDESDQIPMVEKLGQPTIQRGQLLEDIKRNCFFDGEIFNDRQKNYFQFLGQVSDYYSKRISGLLQSGCKNQINRLKNQAKEFLLRACDIDTQYDGANGPDRTHNFFFLFPRLIPSLQRLLFFENFEQLSIDKTIPFSDWVAIKETTEDPVCQSLILEILLFKCLCPTENTEENWVYAEELLEEMATKKLPLVLFPAFKNRTIFLANEQHFHDFPALPFLDKIITGERFGWLTLLVQRLTFQGCDCSALLNSFREYIGGITRSNFPSANLQQWIRFQTAADRLDLIIEEQIRSWRKVETQLQITTDDTHPRQSKNRTNQLQLQQILGAETGEIFLQKVEYFYRKQRDLFLFSTMIQDELFMKKIGELIQKNGENAKIFDCLTDLLATIQTQTEEEKQLIGNLQSMLQQKRTIFQLSLTREDADIYQILKNFFCKILDHGIILPEVYRRIPIPLLDHLFYLLNDSLGNFLEHLVCDLIRSISSGQGRPTEEMDAKIGQIFRLSAQIKNYYFEKIQDHNFRDETYLRLVGKLHDYNHCFLLTMEEPADFLFYLAKMTPVQQRETLSDSRIFSWLSKKLLAKPVDESTAFFTNLTKICSPDCIWNVGIFHYYYQIFSLTEFLTSNSDRINFVLHSPMEKTKFPAPIPPKTFWEQTFSELEIEQLVKQLDKIEKNIEQNFSASLAPLFALFEKISKLLQGFSYAGPTIHPIQEKRWSRLYNKATSALRQALQVRILPCVTLGSTLFKRFENLPPSLAPVLQEFNYAAFREDEKVGHLFSQLRAEICDWSNFRRPLAPYWWKFFENLLSQEREVFFCLFDELLANKLPVTEAEVGNDAIFGGIVSISLAMNDIQQESIHGAMIPACDSDSDTITCALGRVRQIKKKIEDHLRAKPTYRTFKEAIASFPQNVQREVFKSPWLEQQLLHYIKNDKSIRIKKFSEEDHFIALLDDLIASQTDWECCQNLYNIKALQELKNLPEPEGDPQKRLVKIVALLNEMSQTEPVIGLNRRIFDEITVHELIFALQILLGGPMKEREKKIGILEALRGFYGILGQLFDERLFLYDEIGEGNYFALLIGIAHVSIECLEMEERTVVRENFFDLFPPRLWEILLSLPMTGELLQTPMLVNDKNKDYLKHFEKLEQDFESLPTTKLNLCRPFWFSILCSLEMNVALGDPNVRKNREQMRIRTAKIFEKMIRHETFFDLKYFANKTLSTKNHFQPYTIPFLDFLSQEKGFFIEIMNEINQKIPHSKKMTDSFYDFWFSIADYYSSIIRSQFIPQEILLRAQSCVTEIFNENKRISEFLAMSGKGEMSQRASI